jgi:CheY-like chemotaxis protein
VAGEKILSIDDSPTVQRLIEMILSSQGYQVVLASDGEGIARAREENPVILVDRHAQDERLPGSRSEEARNSRTPHHP